MPHNILDSEAVFFFMGLVGQGTTCLQCINTTYSEIQYLFQVIFWLHDLTNSLLDAMWILLLTGQIHIINSHIDFWSLLSSGVINRL